MAAVVKVSESWRDFGCENNNACYAAPWHDELVNEIVNYISLGIVDDK